MAPASCTFTWPVSAATTPAYCGVIESMTVWLVCVPPTRKKISASGHAHALRILSFAMSQISSAPYPWYWFRAISSMRAMISGVAVQE